MTPDQKPTPQTDDHRPEEREPRERTTAPPPLEREHETQQGALEEAERRKRDEPQRP